MLRYFLFASLIFTLGLITVFYSIKFTGLSNNATTSLHAAIMHGEKKLLHNIEKNECALLCYNGQHALLTTLTNEFTINTILHALGNQLTHTARESLIKSILDSRTPFGWSERLPFIIDLDTTSFAWLNLLEYYPAWNNEYVGQSIKSLKLYFAPSQNAYATFLHMQPTRLTSIPSIENNSQLHVNSNIAIFTYFHAAHLDHLINYSLLAKGQDDRGYWPGYFYISDYYTTYHVLKLLCQTHQLPRNVNRGLGFIYTTQNADGSWGKPGNSYESALALNALLSCGEDNQAIKRGINYLLTQQNNTGGWESRAPVWHYLVTSSVEAYAYDSHHVLTTALAVMALKEYSKLNNRHNR